LLVGAVYGGLLGSLFAFVSGTVNLVVVRDVPVYVNWPMVWQSMFLTGLGGAIAGAATARPQEILIGLLSGTLALVTLGTGYMLIQAGLNFPVFTYAVVSFLIWMVFNIPIALGLRLAVQLQDHVLEYPGRQRLWMQTLLLLAIVLAAVISGSGSQMQPKAVSALRRVHLLLTDVLIERPTKPLPLALRMIHDFRERAKLPYGLAPRDARWLSGDVEVHAYFQNGLVLDCLVLSFDIVCSEGEDAFSLGDGLNP
jgi:hypothetical protein